MSILKRILAVIWPEKKPVGILKPEAIWAQDTIGGVLSVIEVREGNIVKFVIDEWTAYYLEDKRQIQSYPKIGQEIWFAMGHTKTESGLNSLDWIYSKDPRKAIDDDNHRALG